VGDRDEKFQGLGKRMAGLLLNAQITVAPGGHGLPLENPVAVAHAIERG